MKIRKNTFSNSRLFSYKKEIEGIKELFINVPFLISPNQDDAKLKNSHYLCLESFSRLIWSFNLLESIDRQKDNYDDGNLWYLHFSEFFLQYFSSFNDKIMYFLYYLYPNNFRAIKKPQHVSYSSMFGHSAKTEYNNDILRIKNFFDENDYSMLRHHRDLLGHEALLAGFTVFDKNGERQEFGIHSTELTFDDFDVKEIGILFNKIFPSIISIMKIEGNAYKRWAIKKMKVGEAKLIL